MDLSAKQAGNYGRGSISLRNPQGGLKRERGQPCPRGLPPKTCDARGQGCPRSFHALLESALDHPPRYGFAFARAGVPCNASSLDAVTQMLSGAGARNAGSGRGGASTRGAYQKRY